MSRNKYSPLVDHICVSVPVIKETHDQSPLDTIQTLVFGFLVFRSRIARRASRTEIGKFLRLDRKAVSRAIQSLERLGIIVADNKGRWSAVEPTGNARDLFRLREKYSSNEEWQSRFVYDRVYLPMSSSVLSLKTNALFWRLFKFGRPVQLMPGYLQVGGHADCPVRFLTMRYLAKSLRCHRTTISSSLDRLRQMKLITVHRIEGHRHKHAFAVGIPPINNRLDLWRRESRKVRSSIVVTAQQLFGVPSATTVVPMQPDRNDPESVFVASRFPTRVVQGLVAMIEEHSVGVDIWRPLLKKASVKHETNAASNPSAADHCGFLFEKMLRDWVKADETRHAIAPSWSPPTCDEMEATRAMEDMRLPPEGHNLLRSAVTQDSLPLADGGCVPCPLNWEQVVAIHKQAKGEWVLFKQAIIQSLFSFSSDRPPECLWYERWLAVEPIPQPDNTPMTQAGLAESDARELRFTVDEWIRTFIEDERRAVAYGDRFVWLAAQQMTRSDIKNAASALAAIAADLRPLELQAVDDGLDKGSPLQFRRY